MLVRTLIRRDFCLGCRKLRMGGLELRLRFGTLSDQLRGFELSDTLACFNARSSVYSNGLHKPGYLWENGHDFVGFNLARQVNRDREFLCDHVRDLNFRTRVRRRSFRGRRILLPARSQKQTCTDRDGLRYLHSSPPPAVSPDFAPVA